MGENTIIVETLKTIKALTSQQMTLSNKIMALKRQLAGKSANVEGVDDVVAIVGDRTPTLTPTTTPISTPKANPESNSNEPKRGRGRPKKNTTVTSIICETRHMPTTPTPTTPTPKDPITAEESPISIYGYNNMGTNIGRTGQSNMNPIYVIEGDELFIRDDNGMLYDIESRDVIGWYNPYASGCSINWLYR